MTGGIELEFPSPFSMYKTLGERPDLAFVYYGFGGASENEDSKVFRIGVLG